MNNIDERLSAAVKHFWLTRIRQARKQGKRGGKDRGARSAATGGAQLDGFVHLITQLLFESGLPSSVVFQRKSAELPGFFRPNKEWDLIVVVDGKLLATVEFKAHIGPSFGNNYNNRVEEALGSATDLWTAYREGAFSASPRPWLGYLMFLEDCPESAKPVAVRELHFPVFEEFRKSSYAMRYEIFCRKLVRERLYDTACLLLSNATGGRSGEYREPSAELNFRQFVASLKARAVAYANNKS